MLDKYGPLLLLIVLLIVVAYAFLWPTNYESPVSITKLSLPEPTCKDGERTACNNSLGCSGERICVDGAWTGCITKRICNPSARAPCIENFCSIGYKVCNECGTVYGECVYTQ